MDADHPENGVLIPCVFTRLILSYPDFPMIYRWPAAALGQLGRAAEAKEWLEKAISGAPAAFNMYVHNRVPWFRPEDHAHLLG